MEATAKQCQIAPGDALPRPEDRPGSDVVIYDGQCAMCTRQVRRLVWWDCQGHLSYLSLHDPLVSERYPDLSHETLMQAMVIVDRDGRRHVGASAVRFLTRRLRRLWWLAPLLHIPGSLPVWRFLYRQVAQRRYRLGGKTECTSDACQRHGS
jgi:predicted DCC family thiol-disulfide oxidoreductase YuxK